MKILHINASPRAASSSLEIALAYLGHLEKLQPIEVDRMDLFAPAALPEFGATAAAAKMALFSGAAMSAEQQQVWSGVRAVFDRLSACELLLINTPLWNNGTPYVLKQFFDLVTQPGWAFGFDPARGYQGLLGGRKALLIQASGVYHEHVGPGFGADFNMPYVLDWLQFTGIELLGRIDFAPTVLNPDVQQTRQAALAQADDLASRTAAAFAAV